MSYICVGCYIVMFFALFIYILACYINSSNAIICMLWFIFNNWKFLSLAFHFFLYPSFITWYQSLCSSTSMAFNPTVSSSSLPPQSSSSLSSTSQYDFAAIAKAFSFIPFKLNSSNYIFWKAQILATVRAFNLTFFLNKLTSPMKYVQDPEGREVGSQIVNPKYLNWLKLDQLLLGWFFSTINKDVLVQVIHWESSVEVWNFLESLYSQQTIAKSF